MSDREIYIEYALKEVPRLLGQLDKNEDSPTFGCFDRNFWHYRIRDYPDTRLQYATLTLAILYNVKSSGNTWLKNPLMKKWATAAMFFWTKAQNPDGSFDEAYPSDRSQPATAFSLYFVAEAFDLMKDELNPDERDRIMNAMEKAVDFVWSGSEALSVARGDPEVSNHDAGSVVALYKMYKLTGSERYRTRAQDMLESLLRHQNDEGWFPEYGGADIGYSTTTLFFLANYYRLSEDSDILNSLERLIRFISYFIHPEGSLGGEYGSRATSFMMPSGFEIISEDIPLAGAIAKLHLKAIKDGKVLTPSKFDDANLCNFQFISYLQAYLYFNPRKKIEKIPCLGGPHTMFFPKSRLFTIKTSSYYAIIAGARGGVMKVFNEKLCYSDTGWIGEVKNRRICSSTFNPTSSVKATEDSFEVSVPFCYTRYTYLSPLKLAFSRLFFPAASRIPFMKKMIKKILRRMMITGRKTFPLKLTRKIRFYDDKVEVTDEFKGDKIKIHSTANFTDTWSYTSGLFQTEDYFLQERVEFDLEDRNTIMRVFYPKNT